MSGLGSGFYSTKEAAKIAKVPRSTLYYWLRTDLFASRRPAHGGPRVLSFVDLRDVVVAQRLREQGAGIADVRRALKWVRDVDDVRGLAEANFAVGEGGLQFLGKDAELVAPHRGHQRIFVIHMADVFRHLGYSEDFATVAPHDRISIDPEVRGGTPVIEGTRIPAQLVAEIAEEESADAVLALYPSLSADDVRAAVEWASEVA
jgi:uncharacterized protein (DUF433 family)